MWLILHIFWTALLLPPLYLGIFEYPSSRRQAVHVTIGTRSNIFLYQMGLRKVCSKLYPQFHHVRQQYNTQHGRGKNELSALKQIEIQYCRQLKR